MQGTHIVVVGAGIVGLAVAHHLQRRGAVVTVVDRDIEGDKASFGNAGGIAVTEVVPPSINNIKGRIWGWMIDPLGPLAVRPRHAWRLAPWLAAFARAGTPAAVDRNSKALAALNSQTYEDLLPMLADNGLTGELQRNGALTLYETAEGFRADAAEWTRKRCAGVVAEDLSAAEARASEPALGDRVHCAVSTPQWSQVTDPRRLVLSLGRSLRRRGVAMRQGEVVDVQASASGGLAVRLGDGGLVFGSAVVIAAGAWSALLARRLGDRVLLESERGYNLTLPDPGVSIGRELIFAERKFVATPLQCGLRIGGAAEFGGLRARPDYRRAHVLARLAAEYLPALRIEGGIPWAGHRPATPDSLPVIGPAGRPGVYYAFGHGHLGLTQAATTGRLISELVFKEPPSIDLTPFASSRFQRRRQEARAA